MPNAPVAAHCVLSCQGAELREECNRAQAVIKLAESLKDHPCQWALEQFGDTGAAARSEILSIFMKYLPDEPVASSPSHTALTSFVLTRTEMNVLGKVVGVVCPTCYVKLRYGICASCFLIGALGSWQAKQWWTGRGCRNG